MHRASLRHRAFDPWPRAAQPWTTQDADAIWSGKTSAYLLKGVSSQLQRMAQLAFSASTSARPNSNPTLVLVK